MPAGELFDPKEASFESVGGAIQHEAIISDPPKQIRTDVISRMLPLKRPDPKTPPYLSWCLITRNCASTVEYTLQSLRERTPDAEIVVVDTCSSDDSGTDIFVPRAQIPANSSDKVLASLLIGEGLEFLFADFHARAFFGEAVRIRLRMAAELGGGDIPWALAPDARIHFRRALELGPAVEMLMTYGRSTVEICKAYADVWECYRGPRGDWTEGMAWFDDAAAARNRSFELASGRWRGWVDADDQLCGPEQAERILRANGRWKPNYGKDGNAKHVIEREQIAVADGQALPTIEDILRHLEKSRPEVECLWAPYPYRMEADGVTAAEWQDRERLIRWDAKSWEERKWHWREEAHEVLVPVNPRHITPPGYLAATVWLHLKRHTTETMEYATRRHWDVLLRKYEAGERNARNCLYLQDYSRLFAPMRRQEFIHAGYEASTSAIDRYRMLMAAAQMNSDQGLLRDAMESVAGAIIHRPDLPDAHLLGGRILADAGDHVQAGRYLATGVRKKHGQMESEIPPRDHLVRFKTLAALEQRSAAKLFEQRTNYEVALTLFAEAANLMEEVCRSDALPKGDEGEAIALYDLIRNDRDGLTTALALRETWQYLIRNDETQKALELRASFPHNLQDHPIALEIERWGVKVKRHLEDPQAYSDFYNDNEATGLVYTEAMGPGVQLSLKARTKQVVAWLNANFTPEKPARVLEVGVNDGSTAIPILEGAGAVIGEFIGLDVHEEALKEFEKRVISRCPKSASYVRTVAGAIGGLGGQLAFLDATFDAIVYLEVIEHVPYPVEALGGMLDLLKPTGRLFISTPWGAYDKGSPVNMEKRDPRGHVRAMLPRDVVEQVEIASGVVDELEGDFGVYGVGATLLASVKNDGDDYRHPLTFAVPSALWDWNFTSLKNRGMGASEETIAYLAEAYGKEGATNVEVYGPLPKDLLVEEEVRSTVKWWPREQVRKINAGGPIIVSRAPFYGRVLDKAIHEYGGLTSQQLENDRYLWLQDTLYDDLTPEIAAEYERIICVSEWHKSFMHEHFKVPLEKIVAIPNFILPEQFTGPAPERRPHHFVYASSPDRALIDLLRIWPGILARWPDATLDIYYGWQGCKHLAATAAPGWMSAYRYTRQWYDRLRYQTGVREVGMVSHPAIAHAMRTSSVWAYPTHFLETCCSNAIKAKAAGAIPVTTPIGALPETASSALTRYVKRSGGERWATEDPAAFAHYAAEFVEAVAEVIDDPEDARAEMSKEAIATYSLSVVKKQWDDLLFSGSPKDL